MVDWKKESMSLAVVIFAVFAAVVMLVSVFGVGIFLTPRSVGSSENAFPHSPNRIPGSVQVKFIESGLTSGTSWSVTLTHSGTHSTLSSTSSDIIFNAAQSTQYSYSVSTVFGTTPSPSSGSLDSGYGVTVDVTYNPAYTVEFAENTSAEVPSGTQWSAKIGSSTYITTGMTIKVGVSDGTLTYTIDKLSQFSPIPASGSLTINGNSVVLEIYFINNSTALGSIKKLVNYFNPNWNYSSIDLTGFTSLVDNATGYINDSADGQIVLNNTTYSFTFLQSEINTSAESNDFSTIDLVNSTVSYFNTTNYNERWSNTSTLNETYTGSSENINQSLTRLRSADYANTSVEVQQYKSNSSPTTSTLYTNSTEVYSLYSNVTNVATGEENVSLHTLDPNYTSTGYYLFSDPNNSVTVVDANLSGNLKNDSSMESYTESVVNNNVTVTIKSDPIYFNFDPGVYQRSFWWGISILFVASMTQPVYTPEDEWLLFVDFLILGTALGEIVAGYAGPVGQAAALAIGILTEFIGYQSFGIEPNYANSNGNVVIYAMAGATVSWFYGIYTYMETGFYSNKYYGINSPSYPNWDYFPNFNTKYWTQALYDEPPHESVWPVHGSAPPGF